MSLFFPTTDCKRITEITPRLLEQLHIKGLILDIDNTLTTHNNPHALDHLEDWLALMQDSDIKLMIVSNNSPERVTAFANSLGLEFTADAMKPLGKGFKAAVAHMNIAKSEVAIVGDQIFTDILGANLFAIQSILVEPIELETAWFFRLKRRLERIILKSYRKRKGQ